MPRIPTRCTMASSPASSRDNARSQARCASACGNASSTPPKSDDRIRSPSFPKVEASGCRGTLSVMTQCPAQCRTGITSAPAESSARTSAPRSDAPECRRRARYAGPHIRRKGRRCTHHFAASLQNALKRVMSHASELRVAAAATAKRGNFLPGERGTPPVLLATIRLMRSGCRAAKPHADHAAPIVKHERQVLRLTRCLRAAIPDRRCVASASAKSYSLSGGFRGEPAQPM